jgi:hypothetical protein
MSTRRTRRIAAILALAGLLLGLMGGAAHAAAPNDVVPDDHYGRTTFNRAWHSGEVDFFGYDCGQPRRCRPVDANITVHDRKGDGTTCTDLQGRVDDTGWVLISTVCQGHTEVIEVRNFGGKGGNVAFRLNIPGIGVSPRILCVRNADGPEPCR